MTTAYASTSEFKQYLGVDIVADDAWWGLALAAAQEGVETYCHRQFYDTGTATARVFVADCADLLRIDDAHTIDTVKTDEGGDGTFETTWAASDYQAEPLNQRANGITGHPYTRLRTIGTRNFPRSRYGRALVEVTASWGWAAVPDTVRTATFELAKDIGKSKDFAAGAIGFGEVVARIRATPQLVSLLGPYRHPDTFPVR